MDVHKQKNSPAKIQVRSGRMCYRCTVAQTDNFGKGMAVEKYANRVNLTT